MLFRRSARPPFTPARVTVLQAPHALSALALGALTALQPAFAQTQAAADGPPTQQVIINASADASAEGLKPAYAGRQVARGGRVGILGNQDIMDTPFSQTSYTQDLIQNQQSASVGDVLKNDPTVRVARGFGNYQQLYVVRGLPVYSDDMSYNGLYGLLPRQYLAAELVERVEVLRGASTFLNGAAPGGSGMGGSVNVMPKRAPNEAITQATIGLETGPQPYLAADISRRFGPDKSTGLRLTAVHRNGDTAVDGEDRELSLVSLGADWRSRDLRISADIGYQNHKLKNARPSVTPAATFIPDAPDTDSNFGQPWVRSSEHDTFGTVRAEYDLSSQVTGWAAFGARHGNEFNDLVSVTSVNEAGDTTAYRFVNQRKDNVATGEVGLRAKLATGSVQHTLVASVAGYHSKERNAYAFSDYTNPFAGNLYSPTNVAAPSADFFTGGSLSDPGVIGRTKSTSLALADTMAFADGSVLLTLGVRYQNLQFFDYDAASGNQTADPKREGLSPVVGIVYKPVKGVSLYANRIEGWTRGEAAPFTSANYGTTLPPYRGKQYEVGAKYDGGRLGAGVSVFQTTKPNGIVDGNNVFVSSGEVRNRGLELSFFGEAARGLRVLGGATWLDSEQVRTTSGTTDGKDAIGTPKWQLTTGVEWDVPGLQGLTLTGRVNHTGKQYADAANTLTVKSSTTLDLGARYGLTVAERLVTLRASVNNLTNRDYWASVGGYPGSNYLVLGAPRTVVVSASVDF
jgi:iron complex outermembrane receptor protein